MGCNFMPSYGLLTNPSNEIISDIINKKKDEMVKLLQRFKQKPIGHTAYWIDLGSDYDYIRHAWIMEAIREIRIARKLGIDLINFHANLNGMFYGEKRKIVLDNLIKSLRAIISHAKKFNVHIMLENTPL